MGNITFQKMSNDDLLKEILITDKILEDLVKDLNKFTSHNDRSNSFLYKTVRSDLEDILKTISELRD